MKNINVKEKFFLWKTYNKFIRVFGTYINKPYQYIVIMPEVVCINELERILKCFIEKYEIKRMAFATCSKLKKEEFMGMPEITIVELTKGECDEIKKVYQLFPVCNNFMFISKNGINGRIIPEDISEFELAEIMLK